MFANFKINISTLKTGTTATTINIPINMDFQIVDQAELIERVFVDKEVEASINPILDYEKVRFIPVNSSGKHIFQINYDVNLFLNGTTNYGAIDYGSIGFSDDDIKFEKNNFKQTFINLAFYDTDNPLTQRLISNITLFSKLNTTDLLPEGTTTGIAGQPKPANQIPLSFVLTNPVLDPKGVAEGYHLYDFKDELKIGEFKYLYMRATFKNAKTGKSTNLMVDNVGYTIDRLVHKVYTRYKLFRTTTGFYYEIDDAYVGEVTSSPKNKNNVTYSSNKITIKLYQIKAL
jgi:hypothetical protein